MSELEKCRRQIEEVRQTASRWPEVRGELQTLTERMRRHLQLLRQAAPRADAERLERARRSLLQVERRLRRKEFQRRVVDAPLWLAASIRQRPLAALALLLALAAAAALIAVF